MKVKCPKCQSPNAKAVRAKSFLDTRDTGGAAPGPGLDPFWIIKLLFRTGGAAAEHQQSAKARPSLLVSCPDCGAEMEIRK